MGLISKSRKRSYHLKSQHLALKRRRKRARLRMMKMTVSPQSQTSGKRNGKERIANLIGVISKGTFREDEVKVTNGVKTGEIGITETVTGTGTGVGSQATVNHNQAVSLASTLVAFLSSA